MGLSNLGAKKIRRVERELGFDIEWITVQCHGDWSIYRVWRKVSGDRVRLYFFDTQTKDLEETDSYQRIDPRTGQYMWEEFIK